MKRKIIIAFSACLIATVSIINVHLTQSDHNMDFSLEDIAVMAQAIETKSIKPNRCGTLYAFQCYEFENSFGCIETHHWGDNCAD